MSLSVDPERREDEHFRYKMPPIMTKVEGGGNGIKTVIPNIIDLSKLLGRPPEVLNKFFGIELGAQATHMKKDDKFLVMGQFTQERMQDLVFKFIIKYVLCKKCRNPETYVVNEQKKPLTLHCKSCGESSVIDPGDKLYNMLSLLYPVMKTVEKAAKKGQAKGAKEDEVEEEGAAALPPPTTAAAPPVAHVDPVAQKALPKTPTEPRPKAAVPAKESPIKLLSQLIQSGEPFDSVVSAVFRLRTDSGLPDNFAVRLAFRGIVLESEKESPPRFIGRLQRQIPLLQRFAEGTENQQFIIQEVQLFSAKHSIHEKVPMALKMLFEEGVLAESEIVDWYDKKCQIKGIKQDVAEEMYRHTTPFVDWLRA